MNKTDLLKPLFLSCLVLSLLFNLYFSLYQTAGPTQGPTEDLVTINNRTIANSFFQVGYSGYVDGFTVKEACSFSNFKIQLCLSGYYFAKYKAALTKNLEYKAEPSIEERLGLGQALALFNKKPLAEPYIIDSWAFAKTLGDPSFSKSLPQSCTELELPPGYAKYCHWGAGRAAFLLSEFTSAEITKSNVYSLLALQFAQVATKAPRFDSIPVSEAKNVENLTGLYIREISNPNWSNKKPDAAFCFINKHLADCF